LFKQNEIRWQPFATRIRRCPCKVGEPLRLKRSEQVNKPLGEGMPLEE